MKLTTFGIDFHEHLKMTNRNIPIVMTKCIIEIESRGTCTIGTVHNTSITIRRYLHQYYYT